MTSYELCDLYKEILDELEGLEPYTTEIQSIFSKISQNNENILDIILQTGINGPTTNQINIIRNENIQSITNFAQKFDMLGNHSKLIEIKKVITEKYEQDHFKEFSQEMIIFFNLIDIFEDVTNKIYNYIKSKKNVALMQMFSSMNNCANQYSKLISGYKQIDTFINRLEYDYEDSNYANYKEISLHFFNREESFTVYIEHFSSINTIYNEIKELTNMNEYELKIVKIESGSIFEKLFGAEKIIDMIALLLKETINLIFKKFTFEGKIARKKDILDFLNDELDLIERMNEMGLNVPEEAKNSITKANTIIAGEVLKIASRSAKIKINDEILSLDENLTNKYIDENKMNLIESKKSEK